MARAARHDVDPTVRHFERSAGEIEIERFREFCDVRRKSPLQLRERGRDRVHLVGRSVRGVAAGIIRLRPAPAAGVVEA